MEWSFDPISIAGSWTVAVAATVLIVLLLIGPSGDRVTRGRQRVLTTLRAAAILVLLLAMLRPTLVYTETVKQPATLLLLLDTSRSMTVADSLGGQSRWDVALKTLADSADTLATIDRDFEVLAYTFDESLKPVPIDSGQLDLPGKPAGDQSAYGFALDKVLADEAGKRILAAVVVGDGAQQALPPIDAPLQLAAAQLRDLGVPLHVVPVGQARGLGQLEDLRIDDLIAPATVFVKNVLTVSGQIRADGFVNKEVPVKLLAETSDGTMKTVDETVLTVERSGELMPFELTYTPQVPGELKLTVVAEGPESERVKSNNRRSTFVQVLKGGLNVLYVEGRPRIEQRFLRRSLDESPDIQLDFLLLDASNADSRPDDLLERFKPGNYDVYILGDVDSSAFTEEELETLAATVNRGAGLMMLGGFHTFGPGGYGETPLAGAIPVTMSRLDRQQLGQPIREDVHIPGPIIVQPTTVGLLHFTLRMAVLPDDNRAAWSELPELDGANRFNGIAPGALVLAASRDDKPLLVTHTFGDGRVIAAAIDETWRWVMHGHENLHKRYWRQSVLWLARKDEAADGFVWVRPDQRRYLPGQRVEFTAGARSPTGDALTDVDFDAEIVLPDGSSEALRLVRRGEESVGSYRDARTAGDYKVRVTARQGSELLGTAEARFLVVDQDLELDNPAADIAALESQAVKTGGKAVAPEQLPDLLAAIAEDTSEFEIQQQTKRTLWDNGWMLLLFAIALGTEWYLRKRWGLV